MASGIQVVGRKFRYDFGDNAAYELHFSRATKLEVTVVADAVYPAGTLNKFDIEMAELRPNVYMVTWIAPQTGNTVTHVEDYEHGVAFSNITDMASQQFWRLKGTIRPAH